MVDSIYDIEGIMTCDCLTERQEPIWRGNELEVFQCVECGRREVYSPSLRLSDAPPHTPKMRTLHTSVLRLVLIQPRIMRSKIAELRTWLMEKRAW